MPDDLIIGRGGSGDSRAIPLGTKSGTQVRNERRRERSPDSLRAAVRIIAENHPLARLRSITSTYNCVGMVFASRRTWVDTDDVLLFLNEDGYRQVRAPEVGDVIVYRNDRSEVKHVGVIIDNRPVEHPGHPFLLVMSKWGGDGEYLHALSDAPPLFGSASDYWTERVTL